MAQDASRQLLVELVMKHPTMFQDIQSNDMHQTKSILFIEFMFHVDLFACDFIPNKYSTHLKKWFRHGRAQRTPRVTDQ